MENGAYRNLDKTILVTAPEALRIDRVAMRDEVTADQVRERMQHQWNDADKIPLADFIIENTDLKSTRRQVAHIHNQLLQLSGSAPESFC
jgi:dephospho-CoA kinase